jgi:Putative TOS1-like glycosyl hydrolase (DUF2401)
MVTATINGQVESWTNNWFGPNGGSSTSVNAIKSTSISAPQGYVATGGVTSKFKKLASPSLEKLTSQSSVGSARHTWRRTGYYDSVPGISDGLTFLNNMGDNVHSGVFD